MTHVRLTVNGTDVEVDAEPRHTLADTLRDRLRLTGVHLGCEHGVCGMCTVLVDGRAERSCLLFTVQLDGAQVITVEALGRPTDLHPIQEAFHSHHALQCGFCTPAFLLSSYELLRDNPSLDGVDLPAELSGVLCRCTGYQGILAAVRDVASRHPDGPPPPGNLRDDRALAVRATRSAAPAGAAARADARPAPVPDPARDTTEVRIPQGEPSAVADVTTSIAVGADEVWRLLADIPRTARCLPGAELQRSTGADSYQGRARIAAGPLRFAFAGTARVLSSDPRTRTLRIVAQGKESGGSTARADLTIRVEAGAAGSTLHATARIFLAGRIARFGRSIAGDISQGMFEQFGRNVEATLTGQTTTTDAATPVRIGTIARGIIASALRRALRRLRPGAHPGPTDRPDTGSPDGTDRP